MKALPLLKIALCVSVCFGVILSPHAYCGPVTAALRETAEAMGATVGRGTAGQAADDVTKAATRVVASHGDDALPLLRHSGQAAALEQAGARSPEALRLIARKGDEALWIIAEPGKLAIFLKHGEPAADALLRHPGIADSLIGHYGEPAVGALNKLTRMGAQRLALVADEGMLLATPRSLELLPILRRYGDEGMDFVWKNKGALAVMTVLTTFLADPGSYISGARQLIVDPLVSPIAHGVNWTLILAAMALVAFLPFTARRIARARSEFDRRPPRLDNGPRALRRGRRPAP